MIENCTYIPSGVEYQESWDNVLYPCPGIGAGDPDQELEGVCGESDRHWRTQSQKGEDAATGAPTVHTAWGRKKIFFSSEQRLFKIGH